MAIFDRDVKRAAEMESELGSDRFLFHEVRTNACACVRVRVRVLGVLRSTAQSEWIDRVRQCLPRRACYPVAPGSARRGVFLSGGPEAHLR